MGKKSAASRQRQNKGGQNISGPNKQMPLAYPTSTQVTKTLTAGEKMPETDTAGHSDNAAPEHSAEYTGHASNTKTAPSAGKHTLAGVPGSHTATHGSGDTAGGADGTLNVDTLATDQQPHAATNTTYSSSQAAATTLHSNPTTATQSFSSTTTPDPWSAYQTLRVQRGWTPEALAELQQHVEQLSGSKQHEKAITLLQAALKDVMTTVIAQRPAAAAAAAVSYLLGKAHFRACQWELAVEHFQWCLPRMASLLTDGADRLMHALKQQMVGICFARLYQYPEALIHLQPAYKYLQTYIGGHHANTIHCASNLADCLYHSTPPDYAAALPLYQQCLEWHQQHKSGDDELLDVTTMVASCQIGIGDSIGASRMLARVTALSSRVHGPEHPLTLTHMHTRALTSSQAGKPAQGQSLLLSVLHTQNTKLGLRHPDTIRTANLLGMVYCLQKRWSDAAQVCQAAWDSADGVLGADHKDLFKHLMVAYTELGQEAEQQRVLSQARARGISEEVARPWDI